MTRAPFARPSRESNSSIAVGHSPGALRDSYGLYVHIPFCLQKCTYCDFVSYPVGSFDTSRYSATVAREIDMAFQGVGWPEGIADCSPSGVTGRGASPSTVFIGGGTPTVLPIADLASVVSSIRRLAGICGLGRWDDNTEFTVEANPGTLSLDYALRLRDLGVNRISLGLQSTSDQHLSLLGRIHSYSEFLAAYDLAATAGFSNVSVDLIYGLPGQTPEEWHEDVSRIADLSPTHVSCYALTLADGTRLCERVSAGELPEPSEDMAADMYFDAVSTLSSAGYRHYEISNYAKPGMECRHNQNYWANGYYLGIGAAAHSHLPGIRCENVSEVAAYIDAVEHETRPLASAERLTPEREASDAFILGLRTSDGVDTALLSERYGAELVLTFVERLKKMKDTGLVEIAKDRVRLTEQGMILSNRVMVELL